MGTSLAIKVMILTPAFRNMNSSFEEASRVSGASTLGTMIRIFVPLMLPVIVAIEFLALLASLQAFEIEQILGTPIGLYVFSTWIYDTLYQHVPRYDAVAALAVLMMIGASGLIMLQRFLVSNRNYTTLTGQFQANLIHLGSWRWPTFAFLFIMAFTIIGVPAVFSLMGTFMKLFGFFIEEPWTLKQWETALNDRLLARALQNTAVLAVGTAAVAIFRALADCLRDCAHPLLCPGGDGLPDVAPIHRARDYSESRAAHHVPTASVPSAVRHHAHPSHSACHLRHALCRADHEGQPPPAWKRAGGGLVGQRRKLVVHLPESGIAAA